MELWDLHLRRHGKRLRAGRIALAMCAAPRTRASILVPADDGQRISASMAMKWIVQIVSPKVKAAVASHPRRAPVSRLLIQLPNVGRKRSLKIDSATRLEVVGPGDVHCLARSPTKTPDNAVLLVENSSPEIVHSNLS